MTLVADITSWLPAHPPSFVPPDYGSDGSLFDLESAGDTEEAERSRSEAAALYKRKGAVARTSLAL